MLRILARVGPQERSGKRKGAILVLAVFFIAGIFTFVGMSVDLGLINVTKSRMQSSADACALAAAQEITVAVRAAAEPGSAVTDVHAFAEQQAVAMAKDIAARNGFFLETSDVNFGRRSWDETTQSFVTDWSASPYNAVKVTVRRDGDNKARGDSKLKLMFAPVYSDKQVSLQAEAAAYVEARDFVTVCDYSGSMNYDSVPFATSKDQGDVRDNLDEIWDALVDSNAYYSNDSSTAKFPTEGWGKLDSYAGTYIPSSSSQAVFDSLELGGSDSTDDSGGVRFYDWTNYQVYMTKLGPGTYDLRYYQGGWLNQDISSFRVDDGYTITMWDLSNESGWKYGPITSDRASFPSGLNNDASWLVIEGPTTTTSYSPYPQEGRNSNGSFKGKPSESESEDMWKDYISWVISRSDDGQSSDLYISSSYDYRYDFGYRTLAMYMLWDKRRNDESEDLFRVPAYPFQAVKDGMSQFDAFLTDLQFGDSLGLVCYGDTARKLNSMSSSDVSAPNNVSDVDLGSTYMTTDYHKIETIQVNHQAAHYTESTNIGDGVKDGREILVSEGRDGARWQMLVMTDGNVNRPSNLPSLPSGWSNFDYDALFDWDGDGVANYNYSSMGSSNRDQKLYLIYEAKLAVEAGITIHAMAVGDGADQNLMRALATMGGGLYIEVDGSTTSEQMSTLLQENFNMLAGNVPPAKLLYE